MKKIFFLLLILIVSAETIYAQKDGMPFRVNGKIVSGIADSIVMKFQGADRKFIQLTEKITDGKFSFSGIIDGAQNALFSLKVPSEDKVSFYIEPTVMEIKIDALKIKDSKLTGSSTQLDAEQLAEALKSTNLSIDSLRRLPKTEDPRKKAEIRKAKEFYSQQSLRVTYEFAHNHPKSYLSQQLVYMNSTRLSQDSIKSFYLKLPKNLKENLIGKWMGQKIAAVERGLPGKSAPMFNAVDLNGRQLSLTDFRGKYVLLDFWATWCVPCRASHPHLRKLFERFHGKGLEIVGISDDDKRAALWKNAIETDSIGSWHQVLAGVDMEKKMKGEPNPKDIMELYGISALPTKILIDPNGKILARIVGDDGSTIDKKLEEFLK